MEFKKPVSKKSSSLTNCTENSDLIPSPRGSIDETLNFEVAELTSRHIRLIESCNGFDLGQAKTHYDSIAEHYDAIYDRLGNPDPAKVAEMVEKHASLRSLNKADCRILDLGCGTGLVGEELEARGFGNIVGLDISPAMIDQADAKAVYGRFV